MPDQQALPLPVLERAQAEFFELRGYRDVGYGKCPTARNRFAAIIDAADANLRTLMGIPDNYTVLFLQGGASLQFCHDSTKPAC